MAPISSACVPSHTRWLEIGRAHVYSSHLAAALPIPAVLFEDVERLFPLAEAVEHRRDGADIERVCPQPHQVAGDRKSTRLLQSLSRRSSDPRSTFRRC